MSRKINNFKPRRQSWRCKFSRKKIAEKKEKALLDEAYEMYGETNKAEEQVPRRRPRTRGLKRALELERQKKVELANQLTFNEQFAVIVNENQEQWLDRANQHLEKLMEKENNDNDILRKRGKHYFNKNQISSSKLQKAKSRLETLTKKNEG